MQTLIFSDVHLTDQFDEKKFVFLKRLISSVDKVIINGDFWDGYAVSFDAFLKSRWNKLFTLLRKNKAIYIFGNHDQKRFSDNRVSAFSIKQVNQYCLKTKKYTLIIEHGNRILPFYDENTEIKTPLLVKIFFRILEKILIKTTGKFFFNFPLGSKLNEKMKRGFQKEFKNGEILVC